MRGLQIIGFVFFILCLSACTDMGSWDYLKIIGKGDVLDSLYARYSFDDGVNPADDVSENGLHGTMMNQAARVLDGERGAVLELDGIDDYVSLPTITGGAAEMTISAWVKITSIPVTFSAIYAVSAFSPRGLHFQITDSGVLRTGIHSNVLVNVDSAYSFNPGGLNTWIHVAAVYSSSASTMQIYVNGILDQTGSYSTVNDVNLGAARIGSWSGDPARMFPGRIDDLRLYSRTLSSKEVQRLCLTTNK